MNQNQLTQKQEISTTLYVLPPIIHSLSTMSESLCGNIVPSKRSLIAMIWSVLNLLVFSSFFIALMVSLYAQNHYNPYNQKKNYYYGEDEDEREEDEFSVSITTRAMAFAAIWTAFLSLVIGIYGTVVIGFVGLNGRYYWCCSRTVHTTTPIILGTFMGALLMFSNLTLICAILFGEFNIRESNERGEGEEGGKEMREAMSAAYQTSSTAFSIMCIFLTVLYAGFAGLLFSFSDEILRENLEDMREEVRD